MSIHAYTPGSAGSSGRATPQFLLPIGVFDSGVGGLTVLSAMRRRLPNERMIYLGDTARLPYGTKSTATVERYALQATEKLVERDIKLLVVACNTATAAALPALQEAYPHLPVIGVVRPGAEAACTASRNGNILVLATESTVRNEAYTKAIQAIRPEARITGVPCSLFVALAEEGWVDSPIVEDVARKYLAPFLGHADARVPAGLGMLPDAPSPEQDEFRVDCIVLGCTHFPPLIPAVRAVVGPAMTLVDSADTTALAVEQELRRLGLLRPLDAPMPLDMHARQGQEGLRFLTTDAPERFARVGSLFLGEPIDAEELELVAL